LLAKSTPGTGHSVQTRSPSRNMSSVFIFSVPTVLSKSGPIGGRCAGERKRGRNIDQFDLILVASLPKPDLRRRSQRLISYGGVQSHIINHYALLKAVKVSKTYVRHRSPLRCTLHQRYGSRRALSIPLWMGTSLRKGKGVTVSPMRSGPKPTRSI
jgi:hypothetical protein